MEIDRFDLGHKVEEQSSREIPRVIQDLTDGTDRKITRNQKRKHDEINHVQKVRINIVNKTMLTSKDQSHGGIGVVIYGQV